MLKGSKSRPPPSLQPWQVGGPIGGRLLLHGFDATTSTLRDAALAPTTLRAYNKHLQIFLAWAGCSLAQLLDRSAQQIDASLAQYIDAAFAARGSYEYACQTLFGLVYRCPFCGCSWGSRAFGSVGGSD